MDWTQLASAFGGSGGSIAGGGGGYSGEISSTIKSGGTNTGTFGAINFGDGAKVGGASTGTEGSNVILYVALAVVGIVALFVFMKR